MQTELETENK